MIFATIKVVKAWDFQQFSSMEGSKRKAIRRALHDDSEKLIQVFITLKILVRSFGRNPGITPLETSDFITLSNTFSKVCIFQFLVFLSL
jgi:hypothetical protein